jgi:hypothetical protein
MYILNNNKKEPVIFNEDYPEVIQKALKTKHFFLDCQGRYADREIWSIDFYYAFGEAKLLLFDSENEYNSFITIYNFGCQDYTSFCKKEA